MNEISETVTDILNEMKRDITVAVRNAVNESDESPDDEKVKEIITGMMLGDRRAVRFTARELLQTAESIFYTIRCDLGVLTPLIKDDKITEIMVNGAHDIYIEREGCVQKSGFAFGTTEELEEVIRRIAAGVHREINEMMPILDARLENGDRVNAVYKNIALGGPSLSIRKFPKTALTMDKLTELGSITEEAALFLKKVVSAGYNCFISGGTSSGKTTFLNILSDYIPKEERIIVIEDSAELRLLGAENIVRLECRNANVHGKGEINMEDLIKTSLRMRPDRIIIGEVRGAECAEMLQAMNTGHAGMSTGHANSVEGMLRRLEAMYLQKAAFPIEAIREQIAQGIDIIVHLGRIAGKGRKVLEIAEIQELRDNKFIINTIFNYKFDKGLTATGNELMNREKLKFAGTEI